MIKNAKATWKFFTDGNASLFVKGFYIAALMYVVMPADFIPDIAPVIGWLDDLGVMAIATAFLMNAIRPYKSGEPEAAAVLPNRPVRGEWHRPAAAPAWSASPQGRRPWGHAAARPGTVETNGVEVG